MKKSSAHKKGCEHNGNPLLCKYVSIWVSFYEGDEFVYDVHITDMEENKLLQKVKVACKFT